MSEVNLKSVGILKMSVSIVYVLSAVAPVGGVFHYITVSAVCFVGFAVPMLHWFLYFTKYQRKNLPVLLMHHVPLVPSVLAICAWGNTLSWTPFIISAFVYWFMVGLVGFLFLHKSGSLTIT